MTSQCDWSSMTLYNNTDPLTVLAGRAKKQLSKLDENAQSPEKERKKERKRGKKILLLILSIQCHVNSAEFKIWQTKLYRFYLSMTARLLWNINAWLICFSSNGIFFSHKWVEWGHMFKIHWTHVTCQ